MVCESVVCAVGDGHGESEDGGAMLRGGEAEERLVLVANCSRASGRGELLTRRLSCSGVR